MIQDGHALAASLFDDVPGPREYIERFGYTPPPTDVVRSNQPLAAEVVHGMWVVRCCKKAGGLVWRPQLLAWCHACGGGWWRVVMPADAEEIEWTLSLRPSPENRNWFSSETLTDLKRQNAEHGVI